MKLKRIILLLVFASLPILFSTYYPQVSDTLRNITIGTVKPVFDLSHFVSSNITEAISNVRGFFRVYEENIALKQEIGALRMRLAHSEEAAKENERLRSLLAFRREKKLRSVAAEIISRDISNWSSWVILGSGSKSGIRPGMPMISPLGVVGRVVSVDENCARAMLITDVKSKLSAMDDRTRDLGLVEGDGRGIFMRYISMDSKMAVGDRIVTSGLGGIYPKGLLIGEVESIGADRGTLALVAKVRPCADLWRLEEILCLEAVQED